MSLFQCTKSAHFVPVKINTLVLSNEWTYAQTDWPAMTWSIKSNEQNKEKRIQW